MMQHRVARQPEPKIALDKLAAYIGAHGRGRLDPRTAGYARLLLLDFIGVGLLGAKAPHIPRVYGTLRSISGMEGAATLTGGRLPPPDAAFMNALCVHSTDWDDSHLSAIVHPGAPVWAAVLGVAERAGASLAEAIAAAVVGYETTIRLGRAIQPQHMFNGFHGTATCGALGAAAAAARLLDLDHDRICNALGLAASSASGLTQCILSGSHAKSFQAAKAAHSGVMAALLASAGLEAPRESIEGPRGFLRAYAIGSQPALLLDDLGEHDGIRDVMVKRYPIAAHLHGAVDAALSLAGMLTIDLKEIVSVQVTIDPAIVRNNSNPGPRDAQSACMSLPFCVACALWLNLRSADRHALDAAAMERGLLEEPVRSLARRVECVPWPADTMRATGTSMWSRVTVRTRDGEWSGQADPLWGASAPGGREIIVEKARRVTASILPDEIQEKWLGMVLTGTRFSLAEVVPVTGG